MNRRPAPLLTAVAAASAAVAAGAPPLTGASLTLHWCDASAPLQLWAFNADGTIAPVSDASLCVTNVGNASLALAPCAAAGATRWRVGPPYG